MTTDKNETLWFVYIVECKDGTLYTGVTTDLTRREKEHNSKHAGARYTRARQPVTMVYSEPATNRSKACKREWEIKQFSKLKKRSLINTEGTSD